MKVLEDEEAIQTLRKIWNDGFDSAIILFKNMLRNTEYVTPETANLLNNELEEEISLYRDNR